MKIEQALKVIRKNFSFKFDNSITYFIILLVLAVIFRYWNHAYLNIVGSDGKGYYAYLPAIFIYHDLDFEFYFNGLLKIDKEYTSSFLYFLDGQNVIKYPAGVAFLLMPFFALACFITWITGGVMDGYSFWFQIMTSIAAITYTTLGLHWIKKMLETFNVEIKTIIWILLLIAFGTNLTFYTVYDASMSHAFSFSMIALLLLSARKFFQNQNTTSLFLCAFAIGTILLIRSLNFLIFLALPALADNKKQLVNAFLWLFRSPLKTFSAILIILTIISIQPILWYLETGKYYVWTYVTEWFDFGHPKIYKALFSYRKGWFVYTPAMILLFPALYLMIRQKKYRETFFIYLTLCGVIYFIASWWCWYFGGSFGTRSIIEFYPLIALPLTFLFNISFSINTILKTFIIMCIALNLFQSFQYKNNILHYDAMTKEKYWKVFLKTSDKYKWSIFANPNNVIDKDIENKLLFRSFNEFDYPVPNWAQFTNIDISDEALSGNKVLSLSELKEPMAFYYKPENQNANQVFNIRFKAWFIGDPAKLNWQLRQQKDGETVFETNPGEYLQKSNNLSVGWQQYHFDISIKYIPGSEIRIEFQKANDKIYMDDAMIFIY